VTNFSHIGPMERFARHWPWMALLACAAVLGVAHAFETFGHMAPCELCLKERQIYWAAGTIAAVGTVLSFTSRGALVVRIANVLLVILFFYSAAVAGYHAGVEWKWWPGPASCSGGSTHVDAGDLSAFLKGGPRAMPNCDKAAWVYLGLSMAGWNAVVSLGLAAASALAAAQGKHAPVGRLL
jgi:disulfide bond formation protein DsbB